MENNRKNDDKTTCTMGTGRYNTWKKLTSASGALEAILGEGECECDGPDVTVDKPSEDLRLVPSHPSPSWVLLSSSPRVAPAGKKTLISVSVSSSSSPSTSSSSSSSTSSSSSSSSSSSCRRGLCGQWDSLLDEVLLPYFCQNAFIYYIKILCIYIFLI